MKQVLYLIFNLICMITFYSCTNSSNTENKKTESGADFFIKNPDYDRNAIIPTARVEEINITTSGNTMDEMKFDKDTIKVKSGTTIRLNFKNSSTDMAMMHNFVLIDPEAIQEVADMGLKAGKDKDFVPEIVSVYVHTKMTKPGESDTLLFPSPLAGIYKFICTYPGHYSKMQGVFIVEE